MRRANRATSQGLAKAIPCFLFSTPHSPFLSTVSSRFGMDQTHNPFLFTVTSQRHPSLVCLLPLHLLLPLWIPPSCRVFAPSVKSGAQGKSAGEGLASAPTAGLILCHSSALHVPKRSTEAHERMADFRLCKILEFGRATADECVYVWSWVYRPMLLCDGNRTEESPILSLCFPALGLLANRYQDVSLLSKMQSWQG